MHFFVQSVQMYSPKKIVQTIKSITAREVLKRYPEVKNQLWGGECWGDGYFVSTLGKHGDEQKIANFVNNHGDYKALYQQLDLVQKEGYWL